MGGGVSFLCKMTYACGYYQAVPLMWLNVKAKSMWFLYFADNCIIEVHYFEPKRTHLDNGCWRWCKCYICRHCEFGPMFL